MVFSRHNLHIYPLRKSRPFDIKKYTEVVYSLLAIQGALFWMWIILEIILYVSGSRYAINF